MNFINIERVVLATTVIAALALQGCTEKVSAPAKASAPASSAALNDPRAKVIGVESAGLANDTVGTTSAAKSAISKVQQDAAMPLPGQANDHSTLSPKATQKAAPPSTGAPPKP